MPYCTKCGKQINEGEVCSCVSDNRNPQQQNREIMSETGKYVRYATGEIKGSVVNSVNTWKTDIKNTDAYERNISIVPDTLSGDEDEIPIKQYNHIARLRSRMLLTWAEGKMQITNKRLIFRAPGRCLLAGKQVLQHEFDIDDVSGVEFKENYRCVFLDVLFAFLIFFFGCGLIGTIFSSMYIGTAAIAVILGIIAGVALLLPIFMLKGFHPYVKLLCYSGAVGAFVPTLIWFSESGSLGAILTFIVVAVLVVGLIIRMLKVMLQPNLAIVVKTKSGLGAVTIRHMPVISFGGILGGNNGIINFTGFEEVLPDVDTEKAIREIGAVIHDTKTMGAKAAEKWR